MPLKGQAELFKGKGIGSVAEFTGYDQLILQRQVLQFGARQLLQYPLRSLHGTAAAGTKWGWFKYAHAILVEQAVEKIVAS
jgi:hypothetical protein